MKPNSVKSPGRCVGQFSDYLQIKGVMFKAAIKAKDTVMHSALMDIALILFIIALLYNSVFYVKMYF